MIYAQMDIETPEPELIRIAAEVVGRGGIVLSPTDTVYGLACAARNERALERLVQIKERPVEKGFLVLLAEIDAAGEIAECLSPDFWSLADALWPGPVTLLLKASTRLPSLVSGVKGQVGCRVPESFFLREWIRRSGTPIVSTSANVSGLPAPKTIAELKNLFQGKVDLFIEGGAPESGRPSTVLDLTVTPFQIVRKGVGLEKVRDCLRRLQREP